MTPQEFEPLGYWMGWTREETADRPTVNDTTN